MINFHGEGEKKRRREKERERRERKGLNKLRRVAEKKIRLKKVKGSIKDATMYIISFHIPSNGRLKFYHVLRDADD